MPAAGESDQAPLQGESEKVLRVWSKMKVKLMFHSQIGSGKPESKFKIKTELNK